MTSVIDIGDNFLMYHENLQDNGIFDYKDKRFTSLQNSKNLCLTCFCPCFVLGQMTSLAAREDPVKLKGRKCILPFGRKGLSTCCYTTALASILWPLSPFLAIFTCIQRRNLSIIYKGDQDENIGWKEASKALIWPCAIVQHKAFLDRRLEEGTLRFDWEYEALADLLKPKPVRKDKIVLIIGPSGAGKTELFKKVIGVSLGLTRQGRHDTKLRMGIRPLRVSDSEMVFLELWDVPTGEFAVIGAELSSVQGIVLVFDCTDPVSLEEMKRLYNSLDSGLVSRVAVACVSNKEDLLTDAEAELGKGGFSSYTRNLGKEWAVHHGIPFYGVSTYSNAGIANLIKVLSA